MKTDSRPICGPLGAALVLSAVAFAADAQDWTRFRGPNGAGVSDATTIPVAWSAGDYNWRVELPGEGHGSPVLWGERIFLMCADQRSAERRVVCLHTGDGRLLWTQPFDSQPHRQHRYNDFGSSTPAADAERVYACWTSPEQLIVLALTHDGKEVWRRDLGPFRSNHGGSISPMLHDGKVVIVNAQMGESFVVALDARSGEDIWRTPLKSVDNGTAYSVPCVYERPGEPAQLTFSTRADGMLGLDPKTGKVLWQLGDLFPLRGVASAAIAGDLVTGNCGEGGGGKRFVAVRPGSADGKREAKIVWELERAMPYVPTAVSFGDRLYYVSDGGHATCLDPATGNVVWQETLGENFFGSPVVVNGVIYIMSRSGTGNVFAIKASDTYELIGKMPLGEMTHATPAVAGGRMYLRTLTHLISVGGKAVN